MCSVGLLVCTPSADKLSFNPCIFLTLAQFFRQKDQMLQTLSKSQPTTLQPETKSVKMNLPVLLALVTWYQVRQRNMKISR